jgi:hypothetical protein
MAKLTEEEIREFIYKQFCIIPCSESAKYERDIIVRLVGEVLENRRDKEHEFIIDKRVKYEPIHIFDDFFVCSYCIENGMLTRDMDYCPNCRKEIDWEEIEIETS